MTLSRRALLARVAAFGVLALAFAALLTATLAQAPSETTLLGDLVSRALSTPTSRVSIGAVDGALSSDATIRNVVVADRDGPWLRLDRARLIWRRAALFSRRLEVDRLEVGRLEILRRPAPGEAAPTAKEPLLPELPLKVEVKAFALSELSLGEPLLGQAARLAASGSAKLGPPAEGLDLAFEARRLDAVGRFSARLAFVPQGERLQIALAHDEPAGGLVARVANLPGLPPVRLDLSGRGTLDDFAAALEASVGPDFGAQGQVRLVRQASERVLDLDLASRIEGLLPNAVAPVFAGATRLQGTARLADGGAVALERLDLASSTARLGLSGTLSAERVLDARITAGAAPAASDASGRQITRAGAAEIERLAFDGSVRGPVDAPRIEGRLDAAGVRMQQGSLASLAVSLLAEPEAPARQHGAAADDARPSKRFRLRADARANGIALKEPAMQTAIGEHAALTLRGVIGTDGAADLEVLRIESPTLDARYMGRAGPSLLAGTLDATLGDLSRFALLAARSDLKGALSLEAKLDGDPSARTLRADLSADGRSIATGITAVDRLLGGKLSLRGAVQNLAEGASLERLRVEGAHVSADANGRVDAGAAALDLRAHIADLARLHPALTGRGDLTAHLTGPLSRPDLTATATAADGARVLGRPLTDARLEAAVRDATGSLDGSLMLSGAIGAKPLRGDLRLRRPDSATWTLDRLDLQVGSARIEGQASLDAAGLGAGLLRIAAPDLDDLSPLALRPLGGSLEAELVLSREGARQDARLTAKGRSLRAAGASLATIDADLRASDLYGRPAIDGRLGAERLTVGGETFERIRLSAVGAPEASDLTLSATARGGLALDGAARLLPGDRTRLNVASLAARRGDRRLALAGPAAITFDDGAAIVSGMVLATDRGGRISLDGRVGDRFDLSLAVRALPLSVADLVSPDLKLSGTLDGEAALSGTAAAPQGRFRATVAGLAAPQTREAGLPPMDAGASGTIDAGRTVLDATATAGRSVQVRAAGQLPLDPNGPVSLALNGSLDARVLDTLLATGGQRVSGRVALDATLAGTLAKPLASGSATLSGGSFTDPLQGVRLTEIKGRVTGRGDAVTVEQLTASTRNGGSLSLTGRIALNPEAGFPGQLQVKTARAELISNEIATVVANLDVTLAGPLARTPRIAGRVDLVSMDVSIPDRLPATLRPLPGTRHVAPPPQVRARLTAAQRSAARQGRRGPAPFDATLDLLLSAPNRIFVRGRGVDAELGGDLKLTGTSRQPVAVGAFELRRGRLSVAGQRLDFSRGRLVFTGDLAPALDFVAETRAGDVKAQVAITGPASQPVFALTSEPALPSDEVLSRLLFAKASGNLSAFQALQLAQAVAQFSGSGSGPDMFEQARRRLGVDSLDIATGASGGPAVGASRYIGDRLSVGVRAGAKPEDSAATATIDVTRRLKVQGEVGADGRSSVGVGAEWEY